MESFPATAIDSNSPLRWQGADPRHRKSLSRTRPTLYPRKQRPLTWIVQGTMTEFKNNNYLTLNYATILAKKPKTGGQGNARRIESQLTSWPAWFELLSQLTLQKHPLRGQLSTTPVCTPWDCVSLSKSYIRPSQQLRVVALGLVCRAIFFCSCH